MKKAGLAEIIFYLKCYPLLRRTLSAEDLKANGASAEVEMGTRNGPEEVEKKVASREPGGWKTMPYIIGNETFERVASFGLTANFTVYLVQFYNMKQVAAVNFTNIMSGTSSFMPLVGAFLADAYWGKFKTLAAACIATLVGMILMTSTAVVKEFRPQSCSTEMQHSGQCKGPNSGQMTMLILALVFLAIGAGGVRPCSLPFGMDQFDRTSEKGRKGMNSYFNWYYTTNTAAVMVALTVVVYVQSSVSWAWGLGIPTFLMLLAIILFFVGTRFYIYVEPEGSIFSGIVQVLVAAFKKRSLKLPSADEQELSLYNPPLTGDPTIVVRLPLTQQYRFLNKAAIKFDGEVNPDNELPLNPWRLCSVQRVEEVKCLIRIIPIWASGITCFVAIGQQWTIAVLQAFTMDRHMGPHFEIPPGSLGVFSLLSIVIFLPIYDQIITPALRKITKQEGGITLLQRMGVGIVISTLSMVVAGVVEAKRRALSNGGSKPMSVFWLVPQLALVGISEAFNAVGQIEFYNQQFPDQIRSLATSLFSCSLAGAGYLSIIVMTMVQKYTGKNGGPNWLDNNVNAGRIDYFYYLLAIMGAANFLYFLVVSHFYHYKGVPKAEGSIRALF